MKAVTFLLIISFTHCVFANEESRILDVLIQAPSLEGNLLGISAERHISIYLPPSYYTDKDRRYPVVYKLHGNRSPTAKRNPWGESFLDLLDTALVDGKLREMILVQPDGTHRYGGCQYANSPVSGNWADFVVKDLVEYMDRNFRTLAKPESRGLTGGSMGGRGVLDIALKFPGVYDVVYAQFPGQMGFRKFRRDANAEGWRKLIETDVSDFSKGGLGRLMGFAVAFSPNPKSPPYFADFPMKLEGDLMQWNEEVLQRWANFDPIEIAAKNADPLSELTALYIDCGDEDRGLEAIRLFSSILNDQNVPHAFEEYQGGHGDPGAKRLKSRVLPAFSKHLAFDQ